MTKRLFFFLHSRGPKPLKRNEMFKRFAWCSIYAWGVPLVLQMAVLLYRQSLGPPVELCWFGNPVSKWNQANSIIRRNLQLTWFVFSSQIFIKYAKCGAGNIQLDLLHPKRTQGLRKSAIFENFCICSCSQQTRKTKVKSIISQW